MPIGSIRRSQLISTFGVGALVPVDDESFMVAGLDFWPVDANELYDIRLQRKLGVRKFVIPRASGDDGGNDVPVVRVPAIYSCPACHRLAKFRALSRPGSNRCLNCNYPLTPSRFLAACEKGHLEDFPYAKWVHDGVDPGAGHDLTVVTAGVSAALKDIVIRCRCGKLRTMDRSFDKFALARLARCSGHRPWLRDREECSAQLRTIQRGASNAYFPITASALVIPPWSESAYKILQGHWQIIQFIQDRPGLTNVIQGLNLAREGFSVETLVEAVIQRQSAGAADSGDVSLLEEEYLALCHGNAERPTVQDFVCTDAPGREEVADVLESVMSVSKLKEIRVLVGFTRLLPPAAGGADRNASLSSGQLDWLPAVEVSGEGAFFKLSDAALSEWESNPGVAARAKKMDDKYSAHFAAYNQVPTRRITPRLVLIHTLAHVLIAQWSLDCGYPSGDLRERLFVSDPSAENPMTGFMIYTASADAAGSLGGVVSLLDRGKLRESLVNAIGTALWCSSDPLCVEAEASGVDSLNLAACHACVLLPETSCVEQNTLLDRAFLIGTPDDPSIGYFSSLIEEVNL